MELDVLYFWVLIKNILISAILDYNIYTVRSQTGVACESVKIFAVLEVVKYFELHANIKSW